MALVLAFSLLRKYFDRNNNNNYIVDKGNVFMFVDVHCEIRVADELLYYCETEKNLLTEPID